MNQPDDRNHSFKPYPGHDEHDSHCQREGFKLDADPTCRACAEALYSRLTIERERTLYSHISNAVNCGGVGDIADEFRRDHRTLQQGFVRKIVKPILEALVEDYDKGYFDLRNESASKWAKQALAATEDQHLPLI